MPTADGPAEGGVDGVCRLIQTGEDIIVHGDVESKQLLSTQIQAAYASLSPARANCDTVRAVARALFRLGSFRQASRVGEMLIRGFQHSTMQDRILLVLSYLQDGKYGLVAGNWPFAKGLASPDQTAEANYGIAISKERMGRIGDAVHALQCMLADCNQVEWRNRAQERLAEFSGKLAQVGPVDTTFNIESYWCHELTDRENTEFVREWSVKALAESKGTQATDAIIQALRDPAPIVRIAAITALRDREDPGLMPMIQPLISDGDPCVRGAAVAALRVLDSVEQQR